MTDTSQVFPMGTANVCVDLSCWPGTPTGRTAQAHPRPTGPQPGEYPCPDCGQEGFWSPKGVRQHQRMMHYLKGETDD